MSKRKNNLEEKMKKRKEEILRRRAKRRTPPQTGFEGHPPGYNFVGPGTNIGNRLSLNYDPDRHPTGRLTFLPISRGDRIAFRHDLMYYADSGVIKEVADADMIRDMIYSWTNMGPKMTGWDDIFTPGIIPVMAYRHFKEYAGPAYFKLLGVKAGKDAFMKLINDLSRGAEMEIDREILRAFAGPIAEARMARQPGIGRRETLREVLWRNLPYVLYGGIMAIPGISDIPDAINKIKDLFNIWVLRQKGGEAFTRELKDVEETYDAYLNSVGSFNENGEFVLKENVNEEEARQNYLNFFAEYRDYISFVNKFPKQTTKYDLPKLNKLNLEVVANPKKFEGNFRNVIKLPPPEDLKPKMQDLFKEDFVKIMEENFDKGELILENRKKNIVEDIKPMETLEDTISQLNESGKTTARGMGFTEVYDWLSKHTRKKGTKISDWEINKWSGFYNDVVKPAAGVLGIKTKKASKNKNKSAQVKNNIKNSKDAIEAIKKRVDAEGTGVLTKIEDFFQNVGSYMGVARVMPYESQKASLDQAINYFKTLPMTPDTEKMVEKLERGKLETLNPKTFYSLVGEAAGLLASARLKQLGASPTIPDPEVIQKKGEDEEIVFGKGKRFEPEQPKEMSRVDMEKFLRSKGHQAPNTWTRKEVEDVYMQEIFGEPPEGPVKIPKARIPKKSREDKISYLRKFGYERDDLANMSLTDLRKLYVKTYGEKGPVSAVEPSPAPTAAPKVEPSPATVGPSPGPLVQPSPGPLVQPSPGPLVQPSPAPVVQPSPAPLPFVEEPVKPLKEPVQKEMLVPKINDQVKPDHSLEPFSQNVSNKEASAVVPDAEEQLRSMNNWEMFDLPITENMDKNYLYQMARNEELDNLEGPATAWYDFTRLQDGPPKSNIDSMAKWNKQAKIETVSEGDETKLLKQGYRLPDNAIFKDVLNNEAEFRATTEAQISESGLLSDSPYTDFSISGMATGSEGIYYSDLRKNNNLYIVP
jgi:hypothetical protein